jgi:hypothetical protein
MTRNLILALVLIAAPVLVGCGSNTTESIDSGTPDAGSTLFGLSAGDNCYTIIAIATGFSDGCGLGVDTIVGTSLPMNYDATTATVTLGTQGSLGGGVIANNQGTLVRDGYPTATGTTCSWHQTDNTLLQMTADNQFTVTVTEVESTFGATCAATDVPVSGTCTSTWTWTMQKSAVTTLVPPACGAAP